MTDIRDSFYMPPKIETNGMTLDASNSMGKEDGISTLKDNIITHEQQSREFLEKPMFLKD